MCQNLKSYLGLFPAGPGVSEVIIRSGETKKEKKNKIIRFFGSWSHSSTLSHRLESSDSKLPSPYSSDRDVDVIFTGDNKLVHLGMKKKRNPVHAGRGRRTRTECVFKAKSLQV